MKRKVSKIILMGAGCSGKDHAKNILNMFGFSSDISCTTRLPRIGETNGKDYIFISERQMLEKIHNKELLQWNQLPNGSCYGTMISEWEEKNVFIMTPNVIDIVKNHYIDRMIDIDFITIGFDIDEDIRFNRLIDGRGCTVEQARERVDMDATMAYYKADIVIRNPKFNDVELLDAIFSNEDFDTEELKARTISKAR